ncbi:hypothetical protein AX14_011156 [Amanita brunnescens Koide BX004]|nr:hypothetical protein AX14_011156 [Amanita brunnescens Koide BX004]
MPTVSPRLPPSTSPALFRSDVGNGTPPPGFDSHGNDDYDDDAYAHALAEADTCDNSSCPRGTDEPATYSITVEQFDEGSEETYERTFRACSACNRSCKKSFMGHRIKARTFDNSAREALVTRTAQRFDNLTKKNAQGSRTAVDSRPARALDSVSRVSEPGSPKTSKTTTEDVPGSATYALDHPVDTCMPLPAPRSSPIPSSTDRTGPVPPLSPDGSLPSVAKLLLKHD